MTCSQKYLRFSRKNVDWMLLRVMKKRRNKESSLHPARCPIEHLMINPWIWPQLRSPVQLARIWGCRMTAQMTSEPPPPWCHLVHTGNTTVCCSTQVLYLGTAFPTVVYAQWFPIPLKRDKHTATSSLLRFTGCCDNRLELGKGDTEVLCLHLWLIFFF